MATSTNSTHHHNHAPNQDQHHPVIVLVVPFPAQGHLGPTLQFSRQILSYNIPVHYASSPIHNRQAKLRAHCSDPHDLSRIQFHDFLIPPFSSLPPDPNSPVHFPAHLQPSFEAFLHLREPVSALVRALSPTAKRVVIVHDPLLASVVQDSALVPNAETYGFHSSPAFFACLFRAIADGKPFELDADLPNVRLSIEDCFTSEFLDFAANQEPFSKIKSGDIHNSSRLIEDAYLHRLAKEGGDYKQWTIGPLIPPSIPGQNNSTPQAKCLEWLNKQARNSVLYISFGTTTSMSDVQIEELAAGLEESEIKFIWVRRDADRGDIFSKDSRSSTQVVQGFEERTEGLGMVTREWMPQLEILGNPAIGGFMTHCGWNSCLESIRMGVPIAAWPMHSDQPSNAVLLTKLLRIGLIVREWDRRKEIVTSASIREAVRTLMASEEGEEMRRRAEELGVGVRKSVMEGGASHVEMESFIAHITR